MSISTITLDVRIKKQLDKLKAHPRESYNEVVSRLLSRGGRTLDLGSFQETVEVLSDVELMQSLARSLEDLRMGRLYPIEDV